MKSSDARARAREGGEEGEDGDSADRATRGGRGGGAGGVGAVGEVAGGVWRCPPAHATHALDATRWFAAHAVAAHAVSIPPDGSSPAARVVPAGHAVQLPDETCWFDRASRAVARRIRLRGVVAGGVRRHPVHATHALTTRVHSSRTESPYTSYRRRTPDRPRRASIPPDTRRTRRSTRVRFVAHAAAAARVSVIVCLVTAPCPAAYPAEISTLDTLVRSAGAVHVNVFVPEAPEFAYCCAVPPHDFAVNPEMVVAVPALACANAADAKPVSVIVIESFGPYVDALAVTNDPTLGVAPIIVAFVMMSSAGHLPVAADLVRRRARRDGERRKEREKPPRRRRARAATRRRAHADASVAR